MLRRLPLKIVILVAIIVIATTPVFAQVVSTPTGNQTTVVPAVPPLTVSSETTNGYQIVISNPRWAAFGLELPALCFTFVVNHADGTPVTFEQTDGAIKVTGWQDSNFDAGIQHSATAGFDTSTHTWSVKLPEVDPRQTDVHLTFDVRDPNTTPGQTTNLVSEFRFNNLPIPTASDVTQTVNDSFTTYFQTVITLTGITLVSNGVNGQSGERFDFKLDHSKVPDDIIGLQVENAYDNGVQAFDVYSQSFGQQSAPVDTATVWTSKIDPSLHKSLSVEFKAVENAYSTVSTLDWTNLAADLPLAGLPFKSDTTSVLDQSSVTANGVNYTLQHVKNANFFEDLYYIFSQPTDITLGARIDNAAFTPLTSNSWQGDYAKANVMNGVFWHPDGTPVLPGESGAYVRLSQNSNLVLPLSFTSTVFSHKQGLVKFSHIAIPAPGQVLILDQLPDKPTIAPIRLRSISWQTPDTSGQFFPQANRLPETLSLVFEYDVSDGSQMNLAPVEALDDLNNALDVSADHNVYPPRGASTVDSKYQTITLSIALPVSGAKTIDLNAVVTKDTPVGPPTKLTVGTDGKLTTME